ncbi:hypothetical protein CBM2637_A60064 [Cupriavidus taiwanensis]|nr:hypothetical protein CBM2637_A60064 [Cupriavidus taiwanensis]
MHRRLRFARSWQREPQRGGWLRTMACRTPLSSSCHRLLPNPSTQTQPQASIFPGAGFVVSGLRRGSRSVFRAQTRPSPPATNPGRL